MSIFDWMWKDGQTLTNIGLSILAGTLIGLLLTKIYKKVIHKTGVIVLVVLLCMSPTIGVSTYLVRINDVIIHFNIFLFMTILSFGLIKFLVPVPIRPEF